MSERLKAARDGAKRNGGTIGVSVSVILAWTLGEYAGIKPPPEVIAAAAGLISALGTYIQRQLEN